MIIKCDQKEFDDIYEIIDDASIAYKGIIPDDRWHDPYRVKLKERTKIVAGWAVITIWAKSIYYWTYRTQNDLKTE